MAAPTYTAYGDSRSGNCYKVQLVLAHCGIAHRWEEVDVLSGRTRSPEFLARNPNGKVPVLERADGATLFESNAIIAYLGRDSALWPQDPWQQAQVLQWQNFEQYSHEPYIAVARFLKHFLGLPAECAAEFAAKQEGGHRALAVMESWLQERDWFVGGALSLADISLYAYTHVADQGGFDLAAYPAVRAWVGRVAAQPGHVPMRDPAPPQVPG